MKNSIPVSAILLAAGEGRRLGGIDKAFLSRHDGATLLEIEIERLRRHCSEILIGVSAKNRRRAKAIAGIGPRVFTGGRTRIGTIRNLLQRVSGDVVLVCDVARPMVPATLIRSLIQAAIVSGAAVPVLPIRLRESLGVLHGPWIRDVLPREHMFLSQTPHAYRTDVLRDALTKADRVLNTGQPLHLLALRAGHPVRAVSGDPKNIKITFPEDLERAGYLGFVRMPRGKPKST